MNDKFQLPHLTKHALIVFLLWAFAPLAWFLIWQDKTYHSWFPKLLWVNGIIFGVIFFTQYFVVIPKLDRIYDVLGVHTPPYLHPLTVIVVLTFAVAQILAGYHLEKKVQKHHKLVEKYLIPIIIIFALDGILALTTGVLSATASPSAILEKYIQSLSSGA